MKNFEVEGVVVRVVTDTVSLSIGAPTEKEALIKAREVLEKFPGEHEIENVRRCYVENRENGEVKVVSAKILKD